MKRAIIRLDDVGDSDWQTYFVIQLCILHRLPISCQVVPNWITSGVSSYLNTLIKNYPDMIEIVQHGFQHKSYAAVGAKNFEFGFHRNYEEQQLDIQEGKRLLQQHFPVGLTPSFTPPWDVLNQDAIKALMANDITSSTGNKYTFEKARAPEGFTAIYCDYDTSIRIGPNRVQRDISDVINPIMNCDQDALGIVMHGKELGSVEATINLIVALKSLENANFSFCLIKDILADAAPSADPIRSRTPPNQKRRLLGCDS